MEKEERKERLLRSMLQGAQEAEQSRDVEYALDSREGILHEYFQIINDPKTKVQDRLRALNLVADLRGLKISKHDKDYTKMMPAELNQLMVDTVVPAIKSYAKLRRKKDVDSTAPDRTEQRA